MQLQEHSLAQQDYNVVGFHADNIVIDASAEVLCCQIL